MRTRTLLPRKFRFCRREVATSSEPEPLFVCIEFIGRLGGSSILSTALPRTMQGNKSGGKTGEVSKDFFQSSGPTGACYPPAVCSSRCRTVQSPILQRQANTTPTHSLINGQIRHRRVSALQIDGGDRQRLVRRGGVGGGPVQPGRKGCNQEDYECV